MNKYDLKIKCPIKGPGLHRLRTTAPFLLFSNNVCSCSYPFVFTNFVSLTADTINDGETEEDREWRQATPTGENDEVQKHTHEGDILWNEGESEESWRGGGPEGTR